MTDGFRARCVMVLGTSSGAGKSWLATALCRWYARQGLKVAPFKAQNMSNNARVVDGGEIGSAQYFQALAARALPDVRMNPVLLKPERDDHSQVVVMGRVAERMSAMPWRQRGAALWPVAGEALDQLREDHDVVVIEGAGSPAEINLKDSDYANMRVALRAKARALLVSDIDRGGAFAHLYGTWSLLEPAERALLAGFVLNKFRGDPKLLPPGPRMLEELTGVPTVAIVPMLWGHGLPEEDGAFERRETNAKGARGPLDPRMTIAIVAYPRIGCLDEFQPLANLPDVRLVWARRPSDLADLAEGDWIVLPGSNETAGDLAWLRARGLDNAVCAHAAAGRPVLGICGGLQMLGEALIDTEQVEGNAAGLGLLPLVTRFPPTKIVTRTNATFGELTGAFGKLSRVRIDGYEIHQGRTAERIAQHPAMAAQGNLARPVLPDGLGWQNGAGNVLGIYLHGLFEDSRALRALFGADAPTLDTVFD
ncbi:MAG: cobyric acid synthase, partial [Burkholderiales bacterium]